MKLTKGDWNVLSQTMREAVYFVNYLALQAIKLNIASQISPSTARLPLLCKGKFGSKNWDHHCSRSWEAKLVSASQSLKDMRNSTKWVWNTAHLVNATIRTRGLQLRHLFQALKVRTNLGSRLWDFQRLQFFPQMFGRRSKTLKLGRWNFACWIQFRC